ncbi:murein hydrolase activator EnvC family protein [Agromyces aerolatus]|uniref:murein hydrolase activator EnvC family protein n=1 Tax=Agromyces sp. LY-1074 TaxID=3074080 RepID=UPI0028676C9A|nr:MULTISPECIES: M23 family metallopeptidase [unclassified Agromyces]MDR5699933.1 M23 family metallopeptidase [Agromyces sp. LY-1074]MDR5706255.1 M23 family metallopeptidase [Agromyces sp. LY-1358]
MDHGGSPRTRGSSTAGRLALVRVLLACVGLVCAVLASGAPVSAVPASVARVSAVPLSAAPADGGHGPRASSWIWPVPPPVRVIAPFRAPLTPYSEGHRGIDLAVAPGAQVVAAAPGVVRFAGWVGDRYLVSIDHGDGVLSSIEPVEPSVAKGNAVARGAPLGRVAAGGHCAAACAHFGVRVDDEYVSPLRFLGGVPRAVLLPLGER